MPKKQENKSDRTALLTLIKHVESTHSGVDLLAHRDEILSFLRELAGVD